MYNDNRRIYSLLSILLINNNCNEIEVIRLLYYLPMERMSYPTYSDLELEIQQLEQENKKLKVEIVSLKEQTVKLTWMAVTYNSVKEKVEKQKEQIEKCKLIFLSINEKLIEEIFWED